MPGEVARSALAGSRFADVRWAAETGSTNADALELARSGAPEGIVIVADHQSAGRGRLGRSWQAPPGASLLVSVLLRPPAGVADAVTMAAAVAMTDAVADVSGIAAAIKWPNDLVVATAAGTRKLAGILAEADWPARSPVSGGWSPPPPTERVTVVVGIGVNANWPDDVPEELRDVLVAANHLTGEAVDREVLLVAFLRHLDDRYRDLVDTGDRTALRDAWRARSATLGRRVRVDLGSGDVEGRAVDIDDAGRLVVETDEGTTRTFAVGDVVHLRSEG